MYDDLYRVTRVIYDDADPTSPTYAAARTDDWLLDTIGNRTKAYLKSATATTYLHNPVNEYTKVGSDNYEYDAAGNLTKDGTYCYYWDYENRLTKVKKVSDNSDVAEYVYDATRRRIEKTDYTADPDETTRFYLDGWSVIEERDGDDTVTATYILGPRIDECITMEREGRTYWYCQSPIVGNVAALLDSDGAIQEGYKYRAYGEATVLTGSGDDETWFTSDDDTASTSALANPYTFTGRRLDDETMLMYFRNRIYRSDDGVFVSRDPLEYVDGMTLYQCARSQPTRVRDPRGLKVLQCPFAGFAGRIDPEYNLYKAVPYESTGSNHAYPLCVYRRRAWATYLCPACCFKTNKPRLMRFMRWETTVFKLEIAFQTPDPITVPMPRGLPSAPTPLSWSGWWNANEIANIRYQCNKVVTTGGLGEGVPSGELPTCDTKNPLP